MNLTGAELISRFLDGCPGDVGRRVAVLGDAAALKPFGFADASDGQVRVLAFDYRECRAQAAAVMRAARRQRQPLLALAVQAPRHEIGGATCRIEGTRRALDAMTPHWFHVNAAAELVLLLPEAWRRSRRGPVLLEIPEDVLAERILGAWIPAAPRDFARTAAAGTIALAA